MLSAHVAQPRVARPSAEPLAPDHPSDSQNPARDSTPTWRFVMIGHADPGLLARVIAPIAKLGLVPRNCGFALRDDGLATVDLAVTGLSRAQADHLRQCYAVMPTMRAVDLSTNGDRDD